MKVRHRHFAATLLILLSSPLLADPPQPQVPTDKLLEGRGQYDAGKYKDAVRTFKEADKLANGSCAECRLWLAKALDKVGAHKDALKNADSVLGMTPNPTLLVGAYNERGVALVGLAENDPKQLEPAEQAFRKALELSEGKVNAIRFSLGVTLLQMSRDAEGVALLKEYLEKGPGSADAEIARKLIANPVRARKKIVPDFELTTLSGEYLTAEDLRGKVLLLDFWGTWCPPCVASVPSLRSLSHRLKDDPFKLVSISTDQDEKALREFVAKNEMDWPQVWDQGQAFTRQCGIHSFPTYVLVSPEGEILRVVSGWGQGTERDLSSRIHAALKDLQRSAKPAR
ncbi:MAG: redoxin family protein [Thermoanaerobaculia bacterium]